MNLYILLDENGLPKDHPMLEENVLQVFSRVDLNNLPSWLAKFERVPSPTRDPLADLYKVQEYHYEMIDGIVKDVWTLRDMTLEEKEIFQETIKQNKPFPSWIFDDPTCQYIAPVPRPTDGKQYYWDESTLSWILAPTPE